MAIDSFNGVPIANIAEINGIPIANIESVNNVAIGAGAIEPLVEAGGPYSGTVNTAIALDATVTPGSDPNPTLLWTIDSGGTGTFSNDAIEDPTFTPDQEGPYVLRLTVTPNDTAAVFDTASLTSEAVVAPTVDAGGPYTGTVSTPIQLDGTVTPGTDPNPVILWTVQSGGTGTFLPDAATIDATFTPDSEGAYVLQLSADPAVGPPVTDTADLTSQPAVPAAPTNLVARVRKVAVLPGVAGDYFRTPDSAANSVTGSFSIVVDFDTSGAVQEPHLFGKYDATTGQRAYSMWYSKPTNTIRLIISNNLTAIQDGGVSLSLEPNQRIKVRVDYNAPGSAATFYADYGDGVWTSLGTDSTYTFTSIANSTGDLQAGSRNVGQTNNLDGKIYRAELYSGPYDPANLVADFNPSYSAGYGTGRSWTAETGEVWTGQGNARISAINNLVIDRFTDANGTLLENHTPDVAVVGGGWDVSLSDLEIQGNELTTRITGTVPNTWIDAGTSNLLVEVEYKQQATGGQADTTTGALIARYPFVRGAGLVFDYYRDSVGEQRVRLREDSTERALLQSSLIPTNGVPVLMSMDVSGARVTCWVDIGDSITYGAAVDTGEFGVGQYFYDRNFQTLYDNFKVTTITDTPTT